MGENTCNQVGTENPNSYARLWSEVGFEPGSTEMKGRWKKPLSQPDLVYMYLELHSMISEFQ